MLHAVAALCVFALVTSCRKEEGKDLGVVVENRKPTQRERYEAEIERIVVGSNMTVFAIAMALADDGTMFYNIIGIIWLNRLILGRKMRLDISDALLLHLPSN